MKAVTNSPQERTALLTILEGLGCEVKTIARIPAEVIKEKWTVADLEGYYPYNSPKAIYDVVSYTVENGLGVGYYCLGAVSAAEMILAVKKIMDNRCPVCGNLRKEKG